MFIETLSSNRKTKLCRSDIGRSSELALAADFSSQHAIPNGEFATLCVLCGEFIAISQL